MNQHPNRVMLRALPSVSALLETPIAQELTRLHNRELVREAVRSLLDAARLEVLAGASAPDQDSLLASLAAVVEDRTRATLQPIINASGIVLHTNLGRAPLGPAVLESLREVAGGYCTLELDLLSGRRGDRSAHARDLLRLVTGAQDALVVNNNAAAVLLALSVLAKGREVIVSRGELIEIGGAFRLPDIMAQSGARMVEVGTTNRTRLADYERAIGPDTALLLKAHPSNFAMVGFTESVAVRELAQLAHDRGLPLLYDLGSGLLRRPQGLALEGEPDVQGALSDGADLVCLSGDKLFGGPQAGIIVGAHALVERCAKAPLMRALRVDKLTYAALQAVCTGVLRGTEALASTNPTLTFLSRGPDALQALAARLHTELVARGVDARVVDSNGQCGGGALPGRVIPSAGVEVIGPARPGGGHDPFAERLHQALLRGAPPVLAVLREGRLILDVLAVFDQQPPVLAEAVARACAQVPSA